MLCVPALAKGGLTVIVAEPLESVPEPIVALPLLVSTRYTVSPLAAEPPVTLTAALIASFRAGLDWDRSTINVVVVLNRTVWTTLLDVLDPYVASPG